MPGTPHQNEVAERRNLTPMEMVIRSMLSYCDVPLSLWMHALRTTMYSLNRVPRKAVPNTPYKLWIGRKPSLRHLQVLVCQAEVRLYNPHTRTTIVVSSMAILKNQKDIDFIALTIVHELLRQEMHARIISGFFIGYPENQRDIDFIVLTIVHELLR